MDTCKIAKCNKPIRARGWCEKHYTRWLKYGDVHKIHKVVGENRTAHPLYKLYHAMHDRCENPNNTFYSYYGGRGIKVCKRWSGLHGFTAFVEDMGERPNGTTLDRQDNSKGYFPTNCRWSSRSQQQRNRRVSSVNSSGYRGISVHKATGRYSAYIHVNRKKIHLGYFKLKKDAVAARKQAEQRLTTNNLKE